MPCLEQDAQYLSLKKLFKFLQRDNIYLDFFNNVVALLNSFILKDSFMFKTALVSYNKILEGYQSVGDYDNSINTLFLFVTIARTIGDFVQELNILDFTENLYPDEIFLCTLRNQIMENISNLFIAAEK